jgi:hypothetical protein
MTCSTPQLAFNRNAGQCPSLWILSYLPASLYDCRPLDLSLDLPQGMLSACMCVLSGGSGSECPTGLCVR